MNAPLTTAQLAALKTHIEANATSITVGGSAVTVSQAFAQSSPDVDDAICQLHYNLFPGSDFFGYYSRVPLAALKGAILWSRMTPLDAVPTTPDLTVQVWKARAVACQGKQINLDMLLRAAGSSQFIDATQRQVVLGFQDAIQAVPSAASGATQDAGWATANTGVRATLCRKATNAEKALADTTNGNGTAQATPANLVVEGTLTLTDVAAARRGFYL